MPTLPPTLGFVASRSAIGRRQGLKLAEHLPQLLTRGTGRGRLGHSLAVQPELIDLVDPLDRTIAEQGDQLLPGQASPCEDGEVGLRLEHRRQLLRGEWRPEREHRQAGRVGEPPVGFLVLGVIGPLGGVKSGGQGLLASGIEPPLPSGDIDVVQRQPESSSRMDQVVLGQQGEVVEDLPDLGLDQRQLPEAREEERQELDQVGIIVVLGIPEGNAGLVADQPDDGLPGDRREK